MVLHPGKKAIRALGIAESFRPTAKWSTLAGVVMRSDLLVDGFVFGAATVGGDDATDSIIKMCRKLRRGDINVVLLSGCIISLYNIVDVDELAKSSGLPVVALTYKESKGIEGAIRHHFARPGERLEKYRGLGRPVPVLLHTGYKVFVRNSEIDESDSKRVLDAFTLQGGVPEPVRVARLLARSRAADSPARS